MGVRSNYYYLHIRVCNVPPYIRDPRVSLYISHCPQSAPLHQSVCPLTSARVTTLHFQLGLVAVGWQEQTLINLWPALNCRCAVLQPAEAWTAGLELGRAPRPAPLPDPRLSSANVAVGQKLNANKWRGIQLMSYRHPMPIWVSGWWGTEKLVGSTFEWKCIAVGRF